jgi:hypothetical protein
MLLIGTACLTSDLLAVEMFLTGTGVLMGSRIGFSAAGASGDPGDEAGTETGVPGDDDARTEAGSDAGTDPGNDAGIEACDDAETEAGNPGDDAKPAVSLSTRLRLALGSAGSLFAGSFGRGDFSVWPRRRLETGTVAVKICVRARGKSDNLINFRLMPVFGTSFISTSASFADSETFALDVSAGARDTRF